MANKELVDLLRQGAEVWNDWRKEHPLEHVDLRLADLSGAHLSDADLRRANLHLRNDAHLRSANLRTDLSGADLSDANLSRANLRRADLSGADLRRANLIGTNLSGADLSGTNLSDADLSRADLIGADLIGADLRMTHLIRTNLSGADLSGADLSDANLGVTIFGSLDLHGVKGLDSCTHFGPSIIDFATLAKSGTLPLVFLRGVGLPDNVIDHLPFPLNEPLQFNSCFISHSSQDKDFAERLYADLQAKDVRCWYAPEDLKIGDEFRSRIDQAIHIHERLLLILSAHSVKSRWVQKEVETAFEKEHKENRLVLFPIRVDEAVMDSSVGWAADIRRARHIGDFTRWEDHTTYQQAFARLLRDLKAEAEKKATSEG